MPDRKFGVILDRKYIEGMTDEQIERQEKSNESQISVLRASLGLNAPRLRRIRRQSILLVEEWKLRKEVTAAIRQMVKGWNPHRLQIAAGYLNELARKSRRKRSS